MLYIVLGIFAVVSVCLISYIVKLHLIIYEKNQEILKLSEPSVDKIEIINIDTSKSTIPDFSEW